MTVAELIEELKRIPQHVPILCYGPVVDESISHIQTTNLRGDIGTVAIIRTIPEPRNEE